MTNDTIAAIATPPGTGAIIIIRISGPQSVEIVNRLFTSAKTLRESPDRTMLYGKIAAPNDKQPIDHVLVVKFSSPRSYTGEDMVEIHCHGSRIIASEIMNALIESGIRPANPGEFSLRAFLNGKIDLVQAEAVADMIQAQTQAALNAARRQFEGELSKKLNHFKNTLKETIALIEAALDFPEEESTFLESKEIREKIRNTAKEIDAIIKGFKYGQKLREGLIVVLAGRPNVGKSSILNRLLQKERAIVSEIPGTTRDSIEEWIDIKGYWIRLIDTAGIGRKGGLLDQKAEEKAISAVENADLILFVIDGSVGFDQKDEQVLNIIQEKCKGRIILLRNKADLGCAALNQTEMQKFKESLVVSAKSGEGFDHLEKAILKQITELPHNDQIICNARHYDELRKTYEELEGALNAIDNRLSEEFIAEHLKAALSCLGKITGEVTVDEILNHIFSKFCIGK